MVKKIIKTLGILAILCSCNNENNISSSNSSLVSNSSSLIISESSNEGISSSTSENAIDYSLFDEKLFGTWYVHSSWVGIFDLNTQIIIDKDYTVKVLNLNLSYVGVYENFEGTALFSNKSGSVKFIASSDEEGVLDWGVFDSVGNQDIGVARKTEHVSGIQYSYEGTQWPIDQINEYLSLNIFLPVYQHDYYYLYTGISQLKDQAYCMIDLYGVSKKARENYTAILEEEGYTFSKDDPTFYTGCNDEKIIAIRLKQYEDNLCIFIYYYSAFYAE